MKTIFTIAIALVFTFANEAFAFDPYDGGTFNNHKILTIGFNYPGNSSGVHYNPYNPNTAYGPNHSNYGHTYCGAGSPHNPHYGNGYTGNHYPNNPNYGNHYPNYPNYGTPYPGNHFVNENSFNGFINALNNEAFDNNKLKMAKFYASSAVLTVQQIGRILQQFTFDNNRLHFAKAAYNNCYDKYNYVLLRNNFQFSSNFNRLMNDIGY